MECVHTYMYMYMHIHVMLVVHVYFCNSYGTFDVHWLMDYDMSILGQDEEGECTLPIMFIERQG